jgi:hypothetical protein
VKWIWCSLSRDTTFSGKRKRNEGAETRNNPQNSQSPIIAREVSNPVATSNRRRDGGGWWSYGFISDLTNKSRLTKRKGEANE